MRQRTADAGQLKVALAILHDAGGRWIGGAELAASVGLDDTRELRARVIWPLRCRYRVPIHSRPGSRGGYKLAVTPAEHRECLDWTDSLGRDFFAIRSILQGETLDVVAAGMIRTLFPIQDTVARPADALSMLIDAEAKQGRRIRFVDVLHNLMATLAERPEQYADEIAEIRSRWGGVFIAPGDRQAMLKHLQAAQAILGGQGGISGS